MEFGKPDWKTYEQGIQKEWLITNGTGGYASSTIIGANTRRYHGLLIASLNPPVNRCMLLSKIDESVIVDGNTHELCSYESSEGIKHGYHYLERVTVKHLPVFNFRVEDIFIEKKISMVYGENTVVIAYHIINGLRDIKLRLTPLVNCRDHHENSNKANMNFRQQCSLRSVVVFPEGYDNRNGVNIFCSTGSFVQEKDKYLVNMEYAIERERGLNSKDDHYIPGYFDIKLDAGEEKYISVLATTERIIKNTDGRALIDAEEKRVETLVDSSGYIDGFARQLVAASDKFIVARQSTGTKTIIAGYPWFTDWGRDTMIAFPGLTLATGRFQDAREILHTFARYVKNGLVPNMFPDEGQEPIYNTVDASLWYFEAINKYLQYTGDHEYIKNKLFGIMNEIIHAYATGTDFGIKMDRDGLISAGDKTTQLTWMDVKVGDWVVTPRHGKAVEINALWYNALKIMANLSEKYGYTNTNYEEMASKAKKAFIDSFWNEKEQCLVDVITEGKKDCSIRPNQIFAVSLSHHIIEGDMAKKVVSRVWKDLYTAYGLRSLAPDEKDYIGIYKGDIYKRDGAYHQGTVWAWLLGHFITAYMKAFGYNEDSRKQALRFIEPMKDHMRDACIGSISEIFDGNEPLLPRGCFAQAWSVAEILRAYVEDIYPHINKKLFPHRVN
ncbi:MAG: amylo-alpha-1,6-glucosidase [Clostridia bacterium]|nr:amylo-alpha-1,6-glucosidase [Clostridia bacterium]